MSILDQLSSQVGDRTEASNRGVASRCLADPRLLAAIAEGLTHPDEALVGDCAEVLTKVAEEEPALVAPFACQLTTLMTHTQTRVRWEVMHALALVATLVPEVITTQIHNFARAIRSDPSVITRDGAVDAVGNYAQTSEAAAETAYGILMEALTLWEGKQGARALRGLSNVAARLPDRRAKLKKLGEQYLEHPRGVVRKAARTLLRATEAPAP
jgi:hypothetical protein